MSVTPEISTLVMKETSEELDQLADILVTINAVKNEQDAVQCLVLDALARIEACKLALNAQTAASSRRLGSPPAGYDFRRTH